MVQMQCSECGTKGGYQIWHYQDCGDTRCTYSKCNGTMNKGLRAAGNYHQIETVQKHSFYIGILEAPYTI